MPRNKRKQNPWHEYPRFLVFLGLKLHLNYGMDHFVWYCSLIWACDVSLVEDRELWNSLLCDNSRVRLCSFEIQIIERQQFFHSKLLLYNLCYFSQCKFSKHFRLMIQNKECWKHWTEMFALHLGDASTIYFEGIRNTVWIGLLANLFV